MGATGYGAAQGLESVLSRLFQEAQAKQQAAEAQARMEMEQRRLSQGQDQFDRLYPLKQAASEANTMRAGASAQLAGQRGQLIGAQTEGLQTKNKGFANDLSRKMSAQVFLDSADMTPEQKMVRAQQEAGQNPMTQAQQQGAASPQKAGQMKAALDAPAADAALNRSTTLKKTIPGANSTGSGGLNPVQSASQARMLRQEWDRTSASVNTMIQQSGMMDAGLEAARKGNLAAGAQAVLVTFQKILDPTSVVRESEYMRSAAGQSVVNQIVGKLEQMAQGGAGVPLPELEKFAGLAKDLIGKSTEAIAGKRARMEAQAAASGIDPKLIFSDANMAPTSSHSGPAPKRVVYGEDGKPIAR